MVVANYSSCYIIAFGDSIYRKHDVIDGDSKQMENKPYVSHAHKNWEFFSHIFSEAIPARTVATSSFLFEYVFLPARKISNLCGSYFSS